MAEQDENPLRIVLLGRIGSGKSATANTILGGNHFICRISAQAVTKSCQKATRKWKGRELLVVDTPGLFDTKESLETTCKEIIRCLLYSWPGPHAIILVLQLGRYTDEEQKTVALIKAVFGEAAMKHMVVLFTRKEELEDMKLKDYIAKSDETLKSLIQECGNRMLAFSNTAAEAEKEDQVQELVQLIDNMVQSNGGSHFPGDIYKETLEKVRRAEALRKMYADQKQQELKTVEAEYAEKRSNIMQEKEKELMLIKMEYEEKLKNIREEAQKTVFSQIVDVIKNLLLQVRHFFSWTK